MIPGQLPSSELSSSMALDRAAKRQLQSWLHFRHRPMTVASLVRFNRRPLLIVYGTGGAMVAVSAACGFRFGVWLYSAMLLATMARDFGNLLRWSRAWPMTRELLDWDGIERLARENGILQDAG
jgi:hypothetical protein